MHMTSIEMTQQGSGVGEVPLAARELLPVKSKKPVIKAMESWKWCFRPGEQPDLGAPGFTRVVHINWPMEQRQKPYKYPTNYISTTKYNIITFLPKCLFEQFRRAANLYFLLCAVVALTPITPFAAYSLIGPLVFVIGVDMCREAIEDFRRFKQDREVNSRKVKVHAGRNLVDRQWKELMVGDVVMVEKDDFFPADLLLLSSSYPDGTCYVETMNLDGETNLKLRKGLTETLEYTGDAKDLDKVNDKLQALDGYIKCEDPNPSLYTFIGNIEIDEETYSLGPQQLLLRDSKLRNTGRIFGVVVFTGKETKVMKNSTEPPSKRSRIERQMDKVIYALFSTLLVLSIISGVVFGVWTSQRKHYWYLRPDDTTSYFDPEEAVLAGFYQFVTALVLYGYLIPISLYVSIAIVKVVQAQFIDMDLEMYYAEIDRPANARTSNLNEELGQVDTILSDKTGTLTANQMDFMKCSIAGVSYGRGVTEIEIAAAKRLGKTLEVPPEELEDAMDSDDDEDDDDANGDDTSSRPPARSGDRKVKFREMKVAPAARKVKGFSLVDSRLQKGNWKEQPNRLEIQQFLRILAVCHTVVPEIEESTGKVKYEAESPDESAFVVAARELGMELRRRTEGSIFIEEPSDDFQTMVESEYKILALIEFNSTRKRMTMIVRMPNSKIQLMCKGADSVIYERLGAKGKQYAPTTFQHLEVFGQAGLRTLALSYRELSEEEYASWAARWKEARTVIGPSRDARIDAEAEFIEVDLVLAGATGIEDKLQKGVPETIDRLAKAGLKIWVLTGDKVETAINIGYATSLLRRGMTQIMIELTDPAIKAAEDAIDKKKIEELSVASIGKQLDDGLKQIRLNEDPDAVFALIIDGKSLAYALEEWARERFLTMAVSCASVLCCRVSPRQKAQVTELVKIGTGAVTLGVGDGANDVGMIQAADIGVGISGVEGMQAVMASDFSIGQFRFLEKLLLVHGHWCYKRIAFMVSYFFYKNITFGLTLFYFNAFAFFSGQTLYNSYYLALYNVFFTSIPVIVIGILEQDVSKRACLSFPILYRQGARNTFFNWGRIGLWAANGVYGSIINCLFVLGAYWYTAASSDGRTAGLGELGTIMYTTIVWTVNLQMAASINYWTIFHHLAVWGSIGLWYLFVVVYGALSVTFSEDAHKVFVETTAPSAKYWLVTLLVPVSCIFPYLAFYGWQRWFNPQDHQIVQEAELLVRKKKLDPELFHSSTMHIPASHGVGFTAAVDHQMKRIQRKMARRKRRGKKTRAL